MANAEAKLDAMMAKAIREENMVMIRKYIRSNGEINTVAQKRLFTEPLLNIALRFPAPPNINMELVRLLVEEGKADLNRPQFPAYNEAISQGRRDVAEYLRAKGASIEMADRRGYTPLQQTARFGDSGTLSYLLARGANPNGRGGHAKTALMTTIEDSLHFSLDVLERLVQGGADVNLVDSKNQTALMCAAIHDNVPAATYLIAHGANVAARNDDGRSASDLATSPAMRAVIAPPPVEALPISRIAAIPAVAYDVANMEDVRLPNPAYVVCLLRRSDGLKAFAMDADALENLKSSIDWLRTPCRPGVQGLMIRRDEVNPAKAMRILNFDMRVYVPNSQVQRLELGSAYLLEETPEQVGRVVSEQVLVNVEAMGRGNAFNREFAVSADHCGEDKVERVYKVSKVVVGAAGGRSRRQGTRGQTRTRRRQTRRRYSPRRY